MDEIDTYVLLDADGTEVSEECDTAERARELLGEQEWEPDTINHLKVVKKTYVFSGEYEDVIF